MSQLHGSVTRLVKQLQAGDPSAVGPLWERYFDQLARLCQAKLASLPSRASDGEDVALSVLDTFIRRVKRRRFPNLRDRKELWSLLFVIALRKSSKVRKRESAKKRGDGNVVGENLLANAAADEGYGLDLAIDKEPPPELVAALADTLERLQENMPEKQLRLAAQLKLEGHTNEEIAREMNCKIATVERRLRLIRKLLTEMDAD